MKAVIALGANIGNPQENIDLAIALLREATDIQAISSMYITAPVGGPEQGQYLNAVAVVKTVLSPEQFLAATQEIELAQNRERNEHWGPRTIDLDLIQYGGLLSKAEELMLPHPRAHERRFVLQPWFEIEPDAILLTHGSVQELLEQLPA